ncbi:MAG: cytochrome c [Chthoniobacteraceae bacterium]
MKKLAFTFALSLCATIASFAQDDVKASAERGKAVYMQTCMACHQPTGLGIPGAFPPFDGSEYVVGDTKRLVALVIKGYTGPITVKGVNFNNILIAVDTQFPILKENAKLADVLNYIRTAWSNKADTAITPDFVQKVRDEFKDRTTPWNAEDLAKAFPAK